MKPPRPGFYPSGVAVFQACAARSRLLTHGTLGALSLRMYAVKSRGAVFLSDYSNIITPQFIVGQ